MSLRELISRGNEWRHDNPDAALGALLLTEISKVYSETDWAYRDEEIAQLKKTAKVFQEIVQTEMGSGSEEAPHALHASWFEMALQLEKEKASFLERVKAIRDFCYQWGFLNNEENDLQDITGPGMEAIDLSATDYSAVVDFASASYETVKRALAAPEKEEVQAFLQGQSLPQEGFFQRESVLLKGYRSALERLAGHDKERTDKKTILEIGPGKGEATIQMMRDGFLVTVVDFQPFEHIEANLNEEWQKNQDQEQPAKLTHLKGKKEKNEKIIKQNQENGREAVYTIRLTGTAEENTSYIQELREKGIQAIFIIAGANAAEEIPLLDKSMDAVGSIYVRHHAGDHQAQLKMIEEMSRVARKLFTLENKPEERAVLVIDADKRRAPFVGMTLPVMAKLHAWATGLDAIITHARGWTPEEVGKDFIAKLDRNSFWATDQFGPEIKFPFLGPIIYPQLVYLVGFDPQRINLRRIGNQL